MRKRWGMFLLLMLLDTCATEGPVNFLGCVIGEGGGGYIKGAGKESSLVLLASKVLKFS